MSRIHSIVPGLVALCLTCTGLLGCNEDATTASDRPDPDSGAASDVSGDGEGGGDGGTSGDVTMSDGGEGTPEDGMGSGDGATGDGRSSRDTFSGGEDTSGDRDTSDSNPDDTGSTRDTMTAQDSSSSDTSGTQDTAVVDATDARDSGSSGGNDGGGVTCSSGLKPCNGTCVDTSSDLDNCGSCGNTCPSNGRCVNGQCQCPKYTQQCGNTCEQITTDPDNCGSCGNQCSNNQVCVNGRCQSQTSCPTGTQPCGQQCVDLEVSDQNCGSCGNTCPSGEGCVNGSCQPQISVGSPPAKCQGGGPPIQVDFSSNNKKCLGNVAQKTFRWAACACNKVDINELYTDAFTSTNASYKKGGLGGAVGSDGYIEFGRASGTEINGALWTSSSRGVNGQNKMSVAQEVHSGGDVDFDGDTPIGGDAYVEGNVTGRGPITFEKTLYLDPSSSIQVRGRNQVNYNKLVRTNVDVKQVCKRCKSSNRIPVKDIVNQHDSGQNDNNLINLKPGALDQPKGPRQLKLPCGEYYLSRIDSQYKTSIVVTGRTALYIGGDIKGQSDVVIKPRPGAELDIFVKGNATLMNEPEIGSPLYPEATRMYVGGSKGITFGNRATLGGFFYAKPGDIDTINMLEVYGGLYTENLVSGTNIRLHYDRAVLDAGSQCPSKNPSGGGDTSSDAGGLDSGSGSDSGGGGGSTCSDKGGSCSTDSDCCSPLVCDSGTCDLLSCIPLEFSCQSDSECCSNNCSNGLCAE